MRMAERIYWRRRLAALAVLVAAAGLIAAVLWISRDSSRQGGPAARDAAAPKAARKPPKPPELPLGGRKIFPRYRVVAYYGAPQAAELGALGIGTPDAMARRLRRLAGHYERHRRPVLLAFELLATVANAAPGLDGMYRTRQPAAIIRRYLRAARRHNALLILDIQPGHADFMAEVRHLDRWLAQPDVGLALDPEWHTPGAQPGTVIGSVSASKVNQVARHVAHIVRAHNLPQKLFVIHQFTNDMIVGKAAVARPPELAVTMNVDGFGTRANKVSKYRMFTRQNRRDRFHDGYKLFYHEDLGLMSPHSVLHLRPAPDFVVYE
jgi:hypothetical protein